MSVIETIKDHPTASGLIGIGALVILYLLFHKGGGTGTQPDASGYDVQAATDTQNAQLQAAQLSAAAGASADNNTTARYVADLQATLQGKTVDASQTVALAQINAAEQYQSLNTTLVAQTQQAAIKAQTDQSQIAASTTQFIASALVQQSQIQASTAQAYINAQTQAANQAAAASIYAADHQKGFLSSIFS